ncbi:polysaccharide deacetylase family protein [Pseudonocardia zijingensis]|jgi:peptidoglycan/xylan/chitin deacetylase (PgdA/CDA1 family)|uniref:NodB homology domain-containing protein n=1 Tax=Pseudonocardia zijingensis TaxID=153376 RepID=A0ABN1NJQ4_9PSEU
MTGSRIALMLHDVLAVGQDPDDSGFPGAAAAHYKIGQRLLDELAAHPMARCAELTFDDGGVNAVRVVAPILERHGLRGTFLVTTSKIGEPGFLDTGDIERLAQHGHLVGSHSHSHPERMPDLPRESALAEWRTSAEILERIVGHPVTIGSVPNGFADDVVVETAAAAGIRVLYTSVPTARRRRHAGVELVGRFAVLRTHDRDRVTALLAGRWAPRARQQVRWYGLAVPKRILGPAYPAVHARIHRVLARGSR